MNKQCTLATAITLFQFRNNNKTLPVIDGMNLLLRRVDVEEGLVGIEGSRRVLSSGNVSNLLNLFVRECDISTTLSVENLPPIVRILHLLEECVNFALLHSLNNLLAVLVVANVLLVVVPVDGNVADRVPEILNVISSQKKVPKQTSSSEES